MFYPIILSTILFFILAWRRLDLAVMFLIAALPAYLIRFNIFGLPSTLLEVMIWAVFLVWAVRNFGRVKNNFLENFKKNNQKIKIRYPFDWEIGSLLIAALTAAGVAGFSASSLGIFKAYFFEPVLLFIVALNVMKREKGLEKILWPLAVSAFLVSVLAIYQKLTGALIDNPVWAAEETRRVVSFFGYPNAVGLYLGPLVLVMAGWLFSAIAIYSRHSRPSRRSVAEADESGNPEIHCWLFRRVFGLRLPVSLYGAGSGRNDNKIVVRDDKIKVFFLGLTIILSVLSIYFAKSKGALLGVAAGLVVFGLLAGKKIRWLAVIVALVAVGGIMSYQPARDLAVRNITLTNLSGQIRQAGWADAWRMLKDGRLLTGAGLANFKAAVAPYHTAGIFIKDPSDPEAQRKLVFNEAYRTAHWQPLEIYLYPHNIVLNFWSELGLAGVLLFIWIIGKYFWMGICVLSLRGACNQATKQSHEQDDQILLRSLQSLAMTDRYIVIGLISAMVVIVVHGMVDVPYFKNDLAVMFWLLIAMMSLVNLRRVKN